MTRRPLAELSDWELEHNDQDLRGTYLQDAQGHNIGKIDQMIVNTDLGYVDALILDNGTEIPIEQIELQDHNQAILKSARATTATTTTSTTTHATTGQTKQQQGEVRLPVIEEELSVGKRQVQQGGVRITTRIREQPVQETVTLREETVNVERQPVNRPASEQDLARVQQGTFEVREVGEEAVVNKQARVTEEVRIKKEVEEHTATIQDEVRRTEVEVEPARTPTKKTSRS